MDPVESIKNDSPLLGDGGEASSPPPSNPVLERLKRLFMPDPRKPAEFHGKFVADWINTRLGPESEEAELGESVNLCLAVLLDRDVGDVPPIVHLGWSGIQYRRLKNKHGDPKMAANQPAR